MSTRPARSGTGARRRPLVPAALTAASVGLALSWAPAARADGPPAAEVVPAVVAAYGSTGTLAVAFSRQEPAVREPLTYSAIQARADRLAEATADNGEVAARPIPSASMVKLYIAEDVLHRARTGAIQLDRTDYATLQRMIRRSDDPAASEMWVRFGGGQMVRDVAARYGLTSTFPPRMPGEWGETTTSARDLARFLSLLPSVAHWADAATLMVWMRTATPIAADGFDQQFGIFGTVPGLPAVKQGWMCCVGGQRHLHSVGVSGNRVVVLLSEMPRSVGYDAARAALSAAAAAIPPPSGG